MIRHLRIHLEKDEDGYPPFASEEIDARSIGDGLYRIEGIPVFARSLACGDVVDVSEAGEELWVNTVVQESGRATVRVLPWDVSTHEAVVADFRRNGCEAYWTKFGVIAVDIPGAVFEGVMSALEEGFNSGCWDYDVGCDPRTVG